jgi:hypothetical protein
MIAGVLQRDPSADLKEQIAAFNKTLAKELATKNAAKLKSAKGLRSKFSVHLANSSLSVGCTYFPGPRGS